MKLSFCIATFIISTLLVNVWGHAVLVDPIPLNTNPVRGPPVCGVSTYPANPVASATWVVGRQVTVSWKLIASDGGATAFSRVDPSGGEAFTVPLWPDSDPISTPNTGVTYTKAFTVPNIDCSTSKSGLCLMRVYSESDWNSCAYINITNCEDCPIPPPPPPVCKVGSNLQFCDDLNGKGVYISRENTPTVIDAEARDIFYRTINNSNVFGNGNSVSCKQDFNTFLCALNLPPCPTENQKQAVGAACKSMCQTAMTSCQLQPGHKDLYPCEDYPLCPGDSESSASSLFAYLFVVSLLVFLL